MTHHLQVLAYLSKKIIPPMCLLSILSEYSAHFWVFCSPHVLGVGWGIDSFTTKQFLDSPGTSCVSYNSTQLWHCRCGASLRSHRLKLSPTRLVSLSLEASVTRPGILVLLNDCLWIRGSHDPLLRFDEFIGVAHRTQEVYSLDYQFITNDMVLNDMNEQSDEDKLGWAPDGCQT